MLDIKSIPQIGYVSTTNFHILQMNKLRLREIDLPSEYVEEQSFLYPDGEGRGAGVGWGGVGSKRNLTR